MSVQSLRCHSLKLILIPKGPYTRTGGKPACPLTGGRGVCFSLWLCVGSWEPSPSPDTQSLSCQAHAAGTPHAPDRGCARAVRAQDAWLPENGHGPGLMNSLAHTDGPSPRAELVPAGQGQNTRTSHSSPQGEAPGRLQAGPQHPIRQQIQAAGEWSRLWGAAVGQWCCCVSGSGRGAWHFLLKGSRS